MRILQVVPYFYPAQSHGGPAYAARGLAKELARRGDVVTVFTTNVDGTQLTDVPLDSPVHLDGVEVVYFPVTAPRRYCFSWTLFRSLERRISEFDIVHIHTIFLWPTSAAAYCCRRARVPYIVRPAGSLDPVALRKPYEPWWSAASSLMRKRAYLATIGKLDLNGATALHYTSDAEMEGARALGLQPFAFALPLGVEVPTAQAATSGVPWADTATLTSRKILLYLSRLDPKKGLSILLEAVALLLQKRRDFALVVAGGGSPSYAKRLLREVHQRGLREHVVFVGPVQGSMKASLLRDADLFVLPSHQENFGLAVAEALAAGLPVVVSDGVNIHTDIQRAGAGIVTSLHPEAIARAVDVLLSSEVLRLEMGERAVALAKERYNWATIAERLAEVYSRILGKGRKVTPENVRC